MYIVLAQIGMVPALAPIQQLSTINLSCTLMIEVLKNRKRQCVYLRSESLPILFELKPLLSLRPMKVYQFPWVLALNNSSLYMSHLAVNKSLDQFEVLFYK